ncbi:MAG: hypothetical protein Q8R00_04790, partial [Candidatus Nanoarchaeia archaeon]|nr:hypothetical protein [Candidatus Nanoarchaeia archaeon]
QMEIEVGGDTEELTFDKDMSYLKTYGDYAVELIQVESLDALDLVERKEVKAGEKTNFIVRAIKNGNYVGGFENYLGTIAHAVVWKEDLTNFKHIHAYSPQMNHGDSIMEKDYGMNLPLQTTFPEPGYYKLFVQFKHEGKIITSDFTIKVN